MKDWFLVPTFKRLRIPKDTNKFYTQSRISRNRSEPVMCILDESGGIAERVSIKRVRTKSVVLADPLRKGDVVMIAYERWAYGRVEERSGNVSVFIEGDGK
jgi:hypothetical protein